MAREVRRLHATLQDVSPFYFMALHANAAPVRTGICAPRRSALYLAGHRPLSPRGVGYSRKSSTRRLRRPDLARTRGCGSGTNRHIRPRLGCNSKTACLHRARLENKRGTDTLRWLWIGTMVIPAASVPAQDARLLVLVRRESFVLPLAACCAVIPRRSSISILRITPSRTASTRLLRTGFAFRAIVITCTSASVSPVHGLPFRRTCAEEATQAICGTPPSDTK